MKAKYIVWNYNNTGKGKVFTVGRKIAKLLLNCNTEELGITIVWIKP